MPSSDDGVREINLSGKQLVFLFMAVTVVSVVIFLCGVLVGRGVQAKVTAGTVAAVPEEPAIDPVIEAEPGTAPSEPTKATGLEYPERLESSDPPQETLVPRDAAAKVSSREPVAAKAADTPAATAAAPSSAPAPSVGSADIGPTTSPAATTPIPPAVKETPLPPEPKGDGFAIQVAALRGRGEAEGVVSRLKQKGYTAYVLPPLAGQPSVFRVRVGKFKARAEAEKVATRLEREEQFKPWITR